jgi:hypothetical protein
MSRQVQNQVSQQQYANSPNYIVTIIIATVRMHTVFISLLTERYWLCIMLSFWPCRLMKPTMPQR